MSGDICNYHNLEEEMIYLFYLVSPLGSRGQECYTYILQGCLSGLVIQVFSVQM